LIRIFKNKTKKKFIFTKFSQIFVKYLPMKKITVLLSLILLSSVAGAQQVDSLKKNEITASSKDSEGNNRNILLNAESSTKPREISIGLPASNGGTEIYEDGMLVGYYFWPIEHETHWRGGESYSEVSTLSLGQNAIRSGYVGYAVDSYTRLGGDKIHGSAVFKANHFGLFGTDININGPLGKGYYFTAGAYFNFDPGSAKMPFAKYIDRTRIFKAGLTKRWNEGRGEISLLYKYYLSAYPNVATIAPFYYEGDGSTSQFDNFRLGLDNYLIDDGIVQYKNIKTGKMETANMGDMGRGEGHDIMLKGKYDFDNGYRLSFTTRVGHGRTNRVLYFSSGIEQYLFDEGYSYLDGTPYAGNVQGLMTLYYNNGTDQSMTTVELSKKSGNHEWLVGVNEWLDHQFLIGSTTSFASTVEVDPLPLLKDGNRGWEYNTSGEYIDGWENKAAIYATHEWTPSTKFNLYYGIRLEAYTVDMDAPWSDYTNPANNRYDGWSLQSPGVTVDHYKRTWINPIGTVNARYSFNSKFGLAADYMFVRQRPRIEHFNLSFPSNTDPEDVHLARLGVTYDNSWINLTSMVSYIYKTNNKSQTRFYKTVGGVTEVQAKLMSYGIATLGWTTDANIHPGEHFSLHLLATFQDPKYTDYATTLTFSDGKTERYDYSGKTVKGIPRFLLEVDPSWSMDKWRVWLSARYFSKHYANLPNTVYFNGHWETFGGFDYKFGEHVSASLNVVNILNQSGAKGTINAADLMTDTSALKHYLMAGSYIRPFTLEASVRLSF